MQEVNGMYLPRKITSNPLEVKESLFETNLINSRCSFDLMFVSFFPHSSKIVDFVAKALIS